MSWDWERAKRPLQTLVAALLLLGGALGMAADTRGAVSDLARSAADNWLAALFVLAGLLLGLFAWRDSLLQALGLESERRVGRRLRDWALRHGYTVKEEDPQEGLEWHYVFCDFQDRPINLVNHSGPREKGVARLLAAVGFDEGEKAAFGQLGETPRALLLSDLRIEMARQGIRYIGITYPWPESIQLSLRFVYEQTSEPQFIDLVQKMTNALVLFTQIVQRHASINAVALAAAEAIEADVTKAEEDM